MTKEKTLTSLQIAQQATLRPIAEIGAEIGLEAEEIELYGRYKAKIDLSVLERLEGAPDGKLVCMTALTPTAKLAASTTAKRRSLWPPMFATFRDSVGLTGHLSNHGFSALLQGLTNSFGKQEASAPQSNRPASS